MKQAQIDFAKDGADLSVEITCGEAQFGSYSLKLWEADRVTLVRQTRGSFLDDEEDRFPLPTPPATNEGCVLQCRARIWLIPPHKAYALTLTVRQGGAELGKVTDSGQTASTSQITEVRANLHGT